MSTASIVEHLVTILGADAVHTGESQRRLRSSDESTHPPSLPDVVVEPSTTDQVSAVLALANRERVPVTPYGAGTSVEGNPIPVEGGIAMSFDRMDAIVAIHDSDFQATVQPGVRRLALEDALGRRGLFFAPDPGADATIGGMIANNAAGIRSVKYGATRDNVLAMTVVLADGRVIRTGSRSVKQSAGYDLRHLVIGSEGTLGVVTEATLKVVPIPAASASVVATFDTVHAAVQGVEAVLGSGLSPAALELLDSSHVATMNQDEGTDFAEAPTLFVELTGNDESTVSASAALVEAACRDVGATQTAASVGHGEASLLRKLRHGVRERYTRRSGGRLMVTLDVSVPISRFADLVMETARLADQHDLDAPILGHAGDGNLHVSLMWDPADDETQRACRQLADRVVDLALSMGGTCTGEHGVGIGKRHYLVDEYGEATVAAMWSIKAALDPHGILNPGKVLPDRW